MIKPKMTEKELKRKYMGVPFRHQGRTIAEGLDCWGFIKLAYKDLYGLEIWDMGADYDQKWAWKGRNYFIENYHREWIVLSKPETRKFDGVMFENSRGVATHTGILLSKNRFMHSKKGAGVIVNRLSHPYWSKRIQGYYRPKAIT